MTIPIRHLRYVAAAAIVASFLLAPSVGAPPEAFGSDTAGGHALTPTAYYGVEARRGRRVDRRRRHIAQGPD